MLDERRGNCLSLSVLYVLAGRRLGMPMRVAVVPRHAFVRYDDGVRRYNIEASMGGMVVSDAYVRGRHCRRGGGPRLLSHLGAAAALLSQAANDLSSRGEGERACRLFARASEWAPGDSQIYHNWGTALLAANRRAEACERFSRALQITPWVAGTYYTWGVALAKLGEHQWACEKFARAVEADPRSALAHFNWAVGLLQLGRRAEGLKRLDRAVALQPGLRPQADKLRAAFQRGASDPRTLKPRVEWD